MDKSAQASGLCLEIGDKLRDLGKVSEAVGFYQRSADLRYHHQEILSFNVENLVWLYDMSLKLDASFLKVVVE